MGTDVNSCPKCGKPLPAGGPQDLCPRCVMAMNMATQTEFTGEEGPHGTKILTPAPLPQDLAAQFPELEVLELLGRGGMGAVYKARQKELDRVVALKILPPGIGDAPGFSERFTREAKALAKLNHPNIVTLYEFGRRNGLFFFLMEYVDGVNLRQLLASGRVSSREALAIVPQICDALQYAHDQGIVHRDIKPDNILMDRRGRVKVADFGLAKIVNEAGSGTAANQTAEAAVGTNSGARELTEAGRIMGTPCYMAPEQEESPLAVDHRADIYALGVVFYQMLTGELPGKPIEPPSRKVQVDVRLDEVVLRALERNPERRYGRAAVLKTQVETIAASEPGAGPVQQRETPLAEKSGLMTSAQQRPNLKASAIGRRRSWWFRTARSFAIALAAAFLIRTFLLAPYVAKSDAAAPEIPRGSRFVVWKLSQHFSPGDLIAYKNEHVVNVGRVVSRDGKTLLVNRSGEPDASIDLDEVLGKVVSVYWRADAKLGGERPGLAPKTGLAATLPDGSFVEFVSLMYGSTPRRTPGQTNHIDFWNPDGTPLNHDLGWSFGPSNLGSRRDPALDYRMFVVRWGGPDENSPRLMGWQIDDNPQDSVDGQFTVSPKGESAENWLGFGQGFPRGQKTAKLRFALASGPYMTGPGSNMLWSSSGATPFGSYSIGKIFDHNGNAAVTLTHNLKGCDYRLRVTVDRFPKPKSRLGGFIWEWQEEFRRSERYPAIEGRVVKGGASNQTFEFPGVSAKEAMSRLPRIDFEVRPVRWVEFENVALNPGEKTFVQARTEPGVADSPPTNSL